MEARHDGGGEEARETAEEAPGLSSSDSCGAPNRMKPRLPRERSSRRAAQSWEAAVAHAAPAMPRPRQRTRAKSPMRLRPAASITDASGLRASLVPMQTACATEATTAAGIARPRMRT